MTYRGLDYHQPMVSIEGALRIPGMTAISRISQMHEITSITIMLHIGLRYEMNRTYQ